MRRLVALVYALIFANELLHAAILPLLPTFARQFALSGVETGGVLAAMPLAMVLVSVPIGLVVDRIGARAVAVAAGALLAVSALVQGFAGSYWVLLAGRVGLGLAFGAIWTAGPALVATSAARRRATAVGAMVTTGGSAHLIGPAFAGHLADAVGVAAPFAALAAAAVVVTVALAVSSPAPVPEHGYQPPLQALRAARSELHVRSAIVVIALLGIVNSTVYLLVPLQLGENGLSAGSIGTILSAAIAVWILASALTARAGERAVILPFAGAGALVLAGALLVPVVSAATAGLVVFLFLRSAFLAPLSTISYPLGQAGARLAGIRDGTVIGLMNLAWAASAVVAPLAGGALAQSAGARWTYILLSACCVAVGAWVLAASRRTEAIEATA